MYRALVIATKVADFMAVALARVSANASLAATRAEFKAVSTRRAAASRRLNNAVDQANAAKLRLDRERTEFAKESAAISEVHPNVA